MIQQSQVKKTQLPTVVSEVPKQSDQQTMEQSNDSKTTCEVTTAVRSERKLPGNLETKPKPEIRQHLVTSPPDLCQPSVIQVNDPPQSQEKHHPSGTVPFPNAVRRTKSRITADTDDIVDLCTEGIIESPQIQIPRSHNLALPPEANPRQSTKTACLTVCQILSRPQVKIHP